MADLEDKELETEAEETEVEPKPEPIREPADPNEAIEVTPERTSRQEKRQNRFKEVNDRAERAERAAEEARREIAALRSERSTPQQQQPSQQEHPAQSRLRQIDEATRRMNEHYQAVASQPGYDRKGPQQQEFERNAQALQTARMAAVAELQQRPIDYDEISRRVAWQQFDQANSDVTRNEKAWNWAVGQWYQRVRGEGAPDTMDLADEILDQARIKFGMQPRKKQGSRPDAALQRRLSGVSAQGGTQSATVDKVSMGKMERQMARVAYPDLEPEKAYQKWANGPGKRAAEKAALRK